MRAFCSNLLRFQNHKLLLTVFYSSIIMQKIGTANLFFGTAAAIFYGLNLQINQLIKVKMRFEMAEKPNQNAFLCI